MRTVFLLLFLLPAIAHACKCPPLSDEEQFAQATVVLEGKILKIEKSKTDQKLTVKPGAIWKGLVLGNLKVYQSDTECRMPLQEGASVLLFLLKDDATKKLYTHLCMGSRALDQAADAIAKFKKLNPPKSAKPSKKTQQNPPVAPRVTVQHE